MKKRLSALLIIFVVMSILYGINAYAFQARFTYISSISSTLSISNKTATCTSDIQASSSVSKIEVTQYLEKKNGTKWETDTTRTWSSSADENYITMVNVKGSLSSGTYRLRTVVIAYSGTNSETVEKLSVEVTI